MIYATKPSVNLEITINWPVKALFNYVSDVVNNPEWQSHVTKAEWINKTETRVGSTFSEVWNLDGCEVLMEMEVTESIPYQKRKITFNGAGSISMDFIPSSEEATQIIINADISERSGDIPLICTDKLRHDLNKLKNILEEIYC